MSAGVGRARLDAGGPARLGDELAARTQPMRGLLARARLPYGAISRLPAELAGSDLLDLVASRVAPSATPGARRPPPRPRPLARAMPDAGSQRRGDRARSEGAVARAASVRTAAAAPVHAPGPTWAAADAHAVHDAREDPVPTSAAAGQRIWSSGPPGAAAGGRGGTAPAPLIRDAARDHALDTPLARAVHRYRAGRAAPVDHGNDRGRMPDARGGRHSPERQAWPPAPGSDDIRTLAKTRLDTAGRASLAATWPEAAVAPGGAVAARPEAGAPDGERVEIRNVFNIGVANGRPEPADPDVLAIQIAQILREQALRHGIDLT
jgi:hypothetical protein